MLPHRPNITISDARSPYLSGHNEPLSYARQGLPDNVLRFIDDPVEMGLVFQALCLQFVDILSAGRSRRKPAVLRHDFQSSDYGIVSWSPREFGHNRLAGQLRDGNIFRR